MGFTCDMDTDQRAEVQNLLPEGSQGTLLGTQLPLRW